MSDFSRLCPRTMFNMFQLDKIVTALFPGHTNARQTIAFPPSSINICNLINNTVFYLDWAIARQENTCANAMMPYFINLTISLP
jgi:hypothetical protein